MMMRLVLVLAVALPGCQSSVTPGWSGEVEEVMDNLTGIPTGKYRTLGPSVQWDSLNLTVGYWCQTPVNGLMFKIDREIGASETVEIAGTLLENIFDPVLRVAVDSYAFEWEYEIESDIWGTYLVERLGEFDKPQSRTELLSALRRVDGMNEAMVTAARRGVSRGGLQELLETAHEVLLGFRLEWPEHEDRFRSWYEHGDSLGVEIGNRVFRFPMDGMFAAVEAVRFFCPMSEAIDSLNAERNRFFGAVDSMMDSRDQQLAEIWGERDRLAREREDLTRTLADMLGGLTNMNYRLAPDFVKWATERGYRHIETKDDVREICEKENGFRGSLSVRTVCRWSRSSASP